MNFPHINTLELDQDFWITFAVIYGLFLPYSLYQLDTFSLIFSPQYICKLIFKIFFYLFENQIRTLLICSFMSTFADTHRCPYRIYSKFQWLERDLATLHIVDGLPKRHTKCCLFRPCSVLLILCIIITVYYKFMHQS